MNRVILGIFLGGAVLLPAHLEAQEQDLHVDSIGHDYGSESAAVHVIEFSDFGCGYCRQFHAESFEPLMDEYVQSGRVRWKYVTYVSGMFPNSREASVAAECAADEGRFDAMRDLLFEGQAEWKAAADPEPLFVAYARQAGAEPDRVAACIGEGRTRERVDAGTRLGLALGVRGTPTFVVDGFPMMGALPLEFLREVLDRRLAAAEPGR
jgi:protein-disulfide isomerase